MPFEYTESKEIIVSEEHNNQNDISYDEATQPLDTSGDIGSEETGSGNEELDVEQIVDY